MGKASARQEDTMRRSCRVDSQTAIRHQSSAHFDAQIECLRRQVFDLIAADEALQQSCKLVVSITGIAAASAHPAPRRAAGLARRHAR